MDPAMNESRHPKIAIVVSRHAAFYSPLIATIAAGFLAEEGLEASYDALRPGQTSRELLSSGAADVMQSAVGSSWGPLDRGETELPVHFAQINRRDGFFVAVRKGAAIAGWKDLAQRRLLADHGGQPLLMLRYACGSQGLAWDSIDAVDAGSPEQMAAAFRRGEAAAVHLQGPAPQQLVEEGLVETLLPVGAAMPEVAFSSVCALPSFVNSETGLRFTRAFARGREWARSAPPELVAEKEADFFPGVTRTALAAAIGAYQRLGCWDGGLRIPEALYEQALDVFEAGGAIQRRHPYERVVAPPPGGLE